MKVSKRKFSFLRSELPLTSKRARYIFSKPKESKELFKVLRANRRLEEGQTPNIIHFESKDVAKELIKMR